MKVKYYRNLLQYLFLVLIFINPFIFWPFLDVSFEIPKVWLVNRIIELIGILALLLSFNLKREKQKYIVIILVFSFYSTAIVSSVLGVDLGKSMIGNYYRADGLITLTHFIILFLFLFLYFQKNWLNKLFKAVALSNFILSTWVFLNFILDLFGRSIFESWDGAIGVNFGNPNFLAGYLLVSLPFTTCFFESRKDTISKLPLIFQLIAIILTRSWGGVIGAAMYVSYVAYKRIKNIKIIFVIFTIFTIIGVGFINNYKSTYQNGILVAESRQRIISKGFLAFAQKPILGWGWANFDHAFDSVDWPLIIYDDVYVDKAHSNLLEILVTTGIVGLTAYLGLLFGVGKNLYRTDSEYRGYLIAAFVLYILHSQTNITSISEELVFWTLAGISAKMG